ncbi:DUF1566 domain-containing protein, partial [Flavobacteriales bacterium]|nr:DUF1566 domain-containing protein [Flavobacteriales bacterium]
EGDTIDLIAIDSSFTPSIGYNGPSWHVCQTGSDIHGDGSLTNPYFSIQTAVDSASSGDSIFVAPGTYYESIYIFDKDLFLLGSGIQQTIIDAQNQNYGIKMYGSNVPDISTIHIEGFTIINAGDGQGQGAGIFLNGNSPSTNTFIYSTILSCEIAYCNQGVDFSNERGTSTIKNNILRNNFSRGLSTSLGFYYIENNTIVENRNGFRGSSGNVGGRYLKNNIIANNTEYGINEHPTTPINSSFNNIWGNGSGSWLNPPTSSVGDISVDPEFISATDFNLLSTSPCIDAGDPDTDGDGISWVTDTDDQDPDGTRIDMGALYYQQGPIVNFDSSVVIPSFNCLSYNWSSGQTQSTITVSPNQTTTYILTVSDGNSTSTDSLTVNVNPLPQPILGPDILQYCSKDTSSSYYNITLNLNPGAGYSNYQWMSIIHDPYGMGGTWDNDTTFLGTDPTYTFSGNTDTITVFVTDSIGCFGSDSIVIQNIISGCTDTNNLVIGDTFGGGIIFYLDGAGTGLIAAPIDQAGYGAAGAYWGCNYFDVPGADGTAIGTGAQNTVDIVNAGCGIAADLCANLILGGFSDWFLPSKDELNQMYLHIGQGDIFDYGNIGGFGSNYHWSSTEYSNTGACLIHFNTGSIQVNHTKNHQSYVRAIRAFTLPGYGCTDSTAFNYDPAATSDNGSCIAVTLGCTDSLAFNFDSLANTNDSSCIAFAYGCTDSTMFNYNSSANTDDGSCIPFMYGCIDLTATNYNQSANTDDGTCTFCYATADIGADTITVCDSVLISTSAITNGSYLWNTSNPLSTSNLAIGDTFQGGIVFYLDSLGGGLISSPSDQGQFEWGCWGDSISGADETAIGTGAQNTIDIVNANCSPNTSGYLIAANVCDTLTLGGYSDWFLPSKDELNAMYLNIGPGSADGGFIIPGLNIGGFTDYFYWSSSENTQGNEGSITNAAWCHIFSVYNGPKQSTSAKYDTMFVRAIRTFSTPINPDTTNSIMVSISGWNYVTVTDSLGCMATDSVYVNINTPNTGTTSVTACDAYSWNGMTYTTSGAYTNTYTNVAGCDSVHTLNLTINYSTSSTDTQIHCDAYSWNGTTYTASGTFTYLTTNAVGCDSIATLNLTINNSYPSSNNITDYYICNGQSLTIANSIYTNPGTYIDSLISINGCDSTVISIVHVSYLSLTSSSTPVTCSNWNDGSVSVSANAGMPPYIYSWSTGNSTAQVDQLPMGNYSVNVSDSVCTITTSANINLNTAPADSMHPEICYVSVDNTGFNRVVLSPLENPLTAQYVIYREYGANLYTPLDTID